MKKSISILNIFIALVLFTTLSVGTASAQVVSSRILITPLQAGTVTIQQGKASVDLSKEVMDELNNKENNPSYYIVFTPVSSDNINITVTNKGEKSFSIKATTGTNTVESAKADYVVFVKETTPVINLHAVSQMKTPVINTK